MADWVKAKFRTTMVRHRCHPLILAGEVDYATHGFPVATERRHCQGIRIKRPCLHWPGLYFNHTVHPFEMKEVRRRCLRHQQRRERRSLAH
jgi:peptide/nickel transport system substrate-binding protein